MKHYRILIIGLSLFILRPAYSVAQQAVDSLLCPQIIYKELYNAYKLKVNDLQRTVIASVSELCPGKRITLNTKFATLDLDSIGMSEVVANTEKMVGYPMQEGQAEQLETVSALADAFRLRSDSAMLLMTYYPWRILFDSRCIHRVRLYDDGIGILSDLIQFYTRDTIQRQIYLEELMHVYDVWYEYADTINARAHIDFSKTLIKSEKARKYDEMLPVLYHLKWDVGNDTLTYSAIQDNVFSPEVSRLYHYMQEALYEQDAKEDLYYEVPYKYFRLSHSRLFQLNKLGKYETYAAQYAKDFDSVNVIYELYQTMNVTSSVSGNITYRHNEISDMYDDASGEMLLASSSNWREKEVEFREQLYEKMDLWDFGLETPDPNFLNRIIRGLGTDSSEVYIEAMERYIEIPPTDEEILNNIMTYRKRLATYYKRNNRLDDAIALYRKIAVDEKTPEGKSIAYYNLAECQFQMRKYSLAQTNYNNALKHNKEFGDVYYKLALCYENMRFYEDNIIDRYKFLLCIDILNEGIACITRNTSGAMRKYNTVSVDKFKERIDELIPFCPSESEAFMLPPNYRTPGSVISFGKIGQTKIRFYSK